MFDTVTDLKNCNNSLMPTSNIIWYAVNGRG